PNRMHLDDDVVIDEEIDHSFTDDDDIVPKSDTKVDRTDHELSNTDQESSVSQDAPNEIESDLHRARFQREAELETLGSHHWALKLGTHEGGEHLIGISMDSRRPDVVKVFDPNRREVEV